MRAASRLLLGLIGAASLSACATKSPEMPVVDYVDIDRFMGDWYVIANIPTMLEKGAHNAVENYSLNDDGTIATHFTYRKGSFDGKHKEYFPKGFISDEKTNAIWGMRFIWPIKADYRIVYLNEDYSITMIGRQKRDFLWIMAREPQIPAADYARLVEFAASLGYATSEIQRVPQRW
ncbi:MAG: lipocalin family protein [Proteobacteria bacterium]|nr:lipocalin family protein [Pseudomonadota bacterium]